MPIFMVGSLRANAGWGVSVMEYGGVIKSELEAVELSVGTAQVVSCFGN